MNGNCGPVTLGLPPHNRLLTHPSVGTAPVQGGGHPFGLCGPSLDGGTQAGESCSVMGPELPTERQGHTLSLWPWLSLDTE